MERRGLRWWLKTAGDRRDGRRRGGRGNENEGEGRVGFSGYFNLLIPLSTRPINSPIDSKQWGRDDNTILSEISVGTR